jgi:gas vesicle protein
MEHRDGTIYFIAGLLMGGLVGAGVGMLLAPESGEKTLAKLKKEGVKVVKRSLDAVDEFEKSDVIPKVKKVAKQIQKKVATAVK